MQWVDKNHTYYANNFLIFWVGWKKWTIAYNLGMKSYS